MSFTEIILRNMKPTDFTKENMQLVWRMAALDLAMLAYDTKALHDFIADTTQKAFPGCEITHLRRNI